MKTSKDRIKELFSIFSKKYWHDPVWSRVIAAAIIAIFGSIIALVWALLKSYYEQISFQNAINQILDLFASSTLISNYIIYFFILLLILLLWNYTGSLLLSIRDKKKNKDSSEPTKPSEELPEIYQQSTVFFSHRLGKAFPGQRGLKWYESKLAVERFKLLFQEPLKFQSSGRYGVMSDPIWWFRGSSSLYINEFQVLSKTKVLLDVDEIVIKRIAVHIDDLYKRCFIYVESIPEKQTGLYKLTADDIQRQIDNHGFAREECGLFDKHYIRREEYDDGAALIKGKVIDTRNAQLRLRFLSPYNFIIAAKQSPYNQKSFYRDSEPYFNNIMLGKGTPEQLFQYLYTLEDEDKW